VLDWIRLGWIDCVAMLIAIAIAIAPPSLLLASYSSYVCSASSHDLRHFSFVLFLRSATVLRSVSYITRSRHFLFSSRNLFLSPFPWFSHATLFVLAVNNADWFGPACLLFVCLLVCFLAFLLSCCFFSPLLFFVVIALIDRCCAFALLVLRRCFMFAFVWDRDRFGVGFLPLYFHLLLFPSPFRCIWIFRFLFIYFSKKTNSCKYKKTGCQYFGDQKL